MKKTIEINFNCHLEAKKECLKIKKMILDFKKIMEAYYAKSKNVFFELSINVVNDKKMISINQQYRNIKATTDVLSFPQSVCLEAKCDLGDIFINEDELSRNKNSEFTTLDYFIHSFLHLNGFTHDGDTDFIKMERMHKKLRKIIKV